MFKPQKPTGPQQPTKHKLPLTERPPKQDDIATLFTGALRIRGTIFELPIRPAPMSPVYILTCQFDHGCNETVWAMYEGSDTGPELFHLPQSDLDMVFDMVCMACQPRGTGPGMPAELAPGAPFQPQQGNTYQPYPPAQQQAPPQQAAQGYPQQQQAPYGAPQLNPYGGQQQYGAPQQQAPYGAPPQQSPYGTPPQQGGYGNQAQQAPYGTPAQHVPYDPYGSQHTGQHQAPTAGSFASGPITPGPDIPMPDFSMMDLINKGSPNVLLGQLFVGSGIVSERGLDAALKLQEMVRGGQLTSEQSVLAMKRAAELGGNLDDDVIAWAKDPDAAQKRQKTATGSIPKAQAPPPRDAVAAQRIADLLKQAGLVTDEDLEIARKVKSKHGGDLTQILVSAGKLSAKTVEAAAEIQNLVAVGSLRIDKAIMALHYCERMRVGLKEALKEIES